MPVRGYKIKSESQSTEQSNIQIKSIEDINPDDVNNFADQFQLFRKYYPNDPESETADKIFAMMEVLEHFRSNIINSPFLSPKDQLSKCRSSFNKALAQHQTSATQGRVSKAQLTPSAYLQNFASIKKLLESTFANVDIEEMIKSFNATRTEINSIVQNLSQIHQKFQNRDKEFLDSYNDFQKTKKTFVTQVNQLREYHQSRRCTSLVTKNNYLLRHFKILCKVLNNKQTNLREKGINYFNDITQYFLEIKAGYLGLNITQRIDHLLRKLYSEKEKQNGTQNSSDNEYDKNGENRLSSRKKKEIHKGRNRRNTRTTSNNSKQVKKTLKNLNSTKDDNNYYEYEEEEEEEDVLEEEYEEEEEEEEETEEEEEEEEEEVKEIIIKQVKRNRRTNSSKSEQVNNAENAGNRRTRSSSRSNSISSSSTQQRSSITNRQSSSENESKKRVGRGRGRSESKNADTPKSTTNDKISTQSNKSSDQSAANKRGRSRNSTKSDSTSSSSISSSSPSRNRRSQTVGIAARILEQSGLSSSSRSKAGQVSDFSSQSPSRRSKRRRGADGNNSDDDNENKSKNSSLSSQSSKEGIYNTRSSARNRDKESKESQSFSISSSSSSSTNIGSGNVGQGRGKGRSNEIETKAQQQERKLVCSKINELTIPLLEIVGRDSLINNNGEEEENENENSNEFPSLIFDPLIELYKSEHPTESGLNSAFIKSCKEFRSFIDSINFDLFSIKLFYLIHKIEVYKIINKLNNKDVDQMISFISLLSEKINKYQQVQFLEMLIIDLIDQITKTSTENSTETFLFGSEPSFLLDIFKEMFDILTPIVCIVKTIMPFNSFIKTNKLTRTCDYLFIPYNNYLDRQSNINSIIHYQPYNIVPFKSIKPNRDFDSFIFLLCQEIEKNGIQIYSKLFLGQEFTCMNIYVPKINELLKNIQHFLSILCESANDENMNQISSNLLTKIYEINKIIEIEKSVCKLKNSPLNLASIIDFDLLLSLIKTLRDIHFLFIALDRRNVISYSNALNLTYARMFIEKICEEDILNDQLLCGPIDPNKSIKIKNILNSSQIELMEEKLKCSYLVRMKSFDYFPSDNYFYTLYNIENIKTPVLKSSTNAPPIYPPELADLVYNARLKSKKNEENQSNENNNNEQEIAIIKRIFGIDKDSSTSIDMKLINGDPVIRALSNIYLDLLEMIAVNDKIFVIPSSLSNFLSLRSQSNEFAEKISIINNFKEFVLIFHETFKINIVSIINSIITEIENIKIQPQQQQEQEQENKEENKNDDDDEISLEASEKVISFLILNEMKRGYLSTITVAQFVKYITNESNKLHEVFCSNEKLMKSILDLCKVVMFIDLHDKIIQSIPSLSNISILRNINLGLFCTSISRNLLFLNSTMTIIISNQSIFSISDLSEMNKFGKFVLSHINEIDKYQKEDLVDSVKHLYQILPPTTDINNELSEEKMNKIERQQRESVFLKLSCSNVKTEIDDFIRFQNDSNKRTLKVTNPILLQLLNSTPNNNKNIVLFCIYAFDVPKSIYSSEEALENRSYISDLAIKQQKRNERLKKVDEVLQLKEMQYLASADSLFIPIPCSLLNKEQQEFMAKYYKKLQDERDELVIKERMFQEFLQKKEILLHQAQEQSVKRKELIEKFYSVRERLTQVAKKAQQREELQKRRNEKEQSNSSLIEIGSTNSNSNSSSSVFKFENDEILENQHLKNTSSIHKIQQDLITLEKRTRQSLENNRNFKKLINDLSKKYEDRQEPQSSSSKQPSKPFSKDFEDFSIKDLADSKIDDFVKNALIEMSLVSEKTFNEIENTANEISRLEEGAANEEAYLFEYERIKDIQQSNELSPEEKESLIALIKEIGMLKKEKDLIQNNNQS